MSIRQGGFVLLGLTLSFLLVTEASAQSATTTESVPASRRVDVSLAYFGELITHPGLAGGPRFALVDRRWFDLTLGPVLGFYVHPRNHTALFIDAEIEPRFTAPFGLFGMLGAAAGYAHTWLGGEGVYEHAEGGGVEKVTDWGRPHFKSGLFLGFGWDLEKNDLLPLRAFARVDVFARMPVNRAVLPQVALQFGAVYRFGGVR